MIMEYLTISAGIFFLMQFINVVLSTMKTILTVKANKHVAMLINTVTYTFYSGVVKLLTEQPMVIVLAVTFLTNMIGVYLALYILVIVVFFSMQIISNKLPISQLNSIGFRFF